MAKARKEVQEKLKQVDVVLEIVDARTPESSRNPMMNEIVGAKPRIMVLNKADLADPAITKLWVKHYQDAGNEAIAIDAQHAKRLNQIPQLANQLMAEKIARKKARGIKNPAIRAMCIGIPNVGKSTILNRLVKKNIAVTGNKPGVTKNQQWLKASDTFQILDTPGILWPKFENQTVGKRLALTGAIADAVFQEDVVGLYGLEFFLNHYPAEIKKAYRLSDDDMALSAPDLLVALTKRQGFGEDFNRMAERIIFDCRQGKLGRFTLEQPGDTDDDAE
ncbi:ras superfamily protein-binding protein YlqF [Lacticaseibacillus saniviri JCM 17471 = DSM 24301]|uniref:Ribosome biogenesis GTPase A n=2 Tax=Lacticaseibacillus saniviri TaxID=931533 RepID=A0A0R2MXY3_9LACO|nr:ras superfamily protein-binding protein YlqF [Lacticaseibacillus saniviri JCM 17471 = DSM 24301]